MEIISADKKYFITYCISLRGWVQDNRRSRKAPNFDNKPNRQWVRFPLRSIGYALKPIQILMIEDRYEKARGCGFRHRGLYMVGGESMAPCGALPIELSVCPCCASGIKPSRGWTWVMKAILQLESLRCSMPGCKGGKLCAPFDGSVDRFGCLWVGSGFYARPADFMREAAEMGISKRISAIPRDFVVGETWVLLAHRDGIRNPDYRNEEETPGIPEYLPAIFSAFRPTRIEYVIDGTESPEKIADMEKRGITCVRVHKLIDEQSTFDFHSNV